MKTTRRFWSCHAQFVLERVMFVTKVADKSKHTFYILWPFFLFSKIVPFMRHVAKYYRAGEATDDNMVHAHCMLNK
jgi:hypothetical protein